jgi:hypothetical protein
LNKDKDVGILTPKAHGHFSVVYSSYPPGYFTHIPITTPVVSALKKLLYIELSRSSSGYFKPLLDPGGGFASAASETAARRFQN